ncbi:MAG: hypothetical protein MJZ11_08125 [Lachnospiraceae bacterium]|nr:hypothetical protein [Lachnospiraceae bacterium]
MKKTLAIIFGAALAVPFLFPACMQKIHSTGFRVITGYVVNELIIATDDGHLWNYDSEIPKGTSVEVVFNTKNTSEIEDDEILIVKEF